MRKLNVRDREEKPLTREQAMKRLLEIRDDLNRSLIAANNRKERCEELLKRPATQKLDEKKRARIAKRLVAAGQHAKEVEANIERVDIEVRNLQ